MKVLVAEDDPVSRHALQNVLAAWGYDAVPCSDGTEAWESLTSDEAYELAILDWMMPGMDGVEVCRRVRQVRGPGSIYIVILTVKGQLEAMLEALDAGADDYLVKPVSKQALRATLTAAPQPVEVDAGL
jgi:hypothetical protein